MTKKVIAVDIGASSGKMAWGEFSGEKLEILEYRDFVNRPVNIGTALYWDVFSLYHAIIDGMSYYKNRYGDADTIAVDTWGASYGLLDKHGRLLEPVYHYRDERTASAIEDMKNVMSPYELFRYTGCQCNRTYTLPQLYSYRTSKDSMLDYGETLLLLPDLLGYFLSGIKTTEMTIAGTSCLLESQQERWSEIVAERFSIPEKLYTEIVLPGTFKGPLSNIIKTQTGMKETKLVATVSHDSAAAVAAIPGFGEEKLYISIGTNISMGIERNQSLVTKSAYEKGFKNTGGIGKSKIVYRDFSACWYINEFLRTRKEQGISYTYSELVKLAEMQKDPVSWFDVEDVELNYAGGDLCEKLNQYFLKTGQRILTEESEFVRSILESIALKIGYYADAFKELGLYYKKIFVINGGVRNFLLMQMISNILGCEISAGMEYATLAGNLLTQLYALGEVSTAKEMRGLSEKSFHMRTYEPEDQSVWKEALIQYKKIINGM